MKIAIPVNETSDQATVCVSFGRAPYFAVYDTVSKSTQFIDNHIAAESQGGAGTKAAQCVVDAESSAVITPRCGENAAKVFELAEIKLYQSESDSLEANIAAYVKGELKKLTNIHAGFHGK